MVRIGITVLALCLISAAQSNGQALYQQAINKLSGSVTQRSPIDAADLMRKAADAGYAPAQTALGYWLENRGGRAIARRCGRAIVRSFFEPGLRLRFIFGNADAQRIGAAESVLAEAVALLGGAAG